MKTLSTVMAAGIAALLSATAAQSQDAAALNDLEIAHVAYVADNIDIRYAHLALAISTNPAIHEFANTMIRDHTAVNEQALALLAKLGAQAQDNFLSQTLLQYRLLDLQEIMAKLPASAAQEVELDEDELPAL